MLENPLIGEQIRRLTVKIVSLKSNETGSGIIYQSDNYLDKIFIFTAKHCLCGKKMLIDPEPSDIAISFYDDQTKSYHQIPLSANSSSYYFDGAEKDIAVIILPKIGLPISLTGLPKVRLVEDTKGIRNTAIFGFPKGSPNLSIERIDTVLQLPTEDYSWKAEPQRFISSEEFDRTKTSMEGFSGGGFIVNTLDEFFLFGIGTDFPEWNRFLGMKIHLVNELLELKGLSTEPFYQLETNEEVKKAITFLDRNTTIIRSNIQRKSKLGKINQVKLDRKDLQEKVASGLDENKVIIINGHAGYGKSVLAEDTLSGLGNRYTIWAIKAEQLINQSIDELLWEALSKATFLEVLDSPLLLKEKVILIDSVEKLLETQELDNLEALFDLVEQRADVKIVLTIRDYALGVLLNLPRSKYTTIEVPRITDLEIQQIEKSYPEVTKLLANDKIKSILRIPFYLHYVLPLLPQLIVNEDLNERKLKIELWKKVIEKTQALRGSVFDKLALKRAEEMKFYVPLEDTSPDILTALTQDEIIIQFEDKYGILSYAPAHDIFEDWALVRYIQKQRETANNDLLSFYNNIDKSYAIRRGFRFWLQEELSDTDPSFFFANFIAKSLEHPKLLSYWKDEILVAILLSNHCTKFLNGNKDKILAAKAQLLVRLIHLLRTACKKPFKSVLKETASNQRTRLYSFNFEPIGDSWVSIISFIHQNQNIVTDHPILVLDLLLDWEKILHKYSFLPSESRMVGEILLNILRIKKLDYYEGFASSTNEKIEKGLALLLRLTEILQEEIQSILLESLELYKKRRKIYNEQRNNFGRTDVYDQPIPSSDDVLVDKYSRKILKLAVSCLEAKHLCIYLPDLVMGIAKELWLSDRETSRNAYSGNGVEEYFGLVGDYEMKYYPASAYQTPTYFLLFFHPYKTLPFIVDIVNYATEHYSKSSFGLDSGVKCDKLKLNTGEEITKWHNMTLWVMYRSLSVGTAKPDLLQSMMMALEKWMLLLGKSKRKEDHELLIYSVKYLLKNSNSAMTTGVIASISMAYPFILMLDLLPIFTIPEFFLLDKHRQLNRNFIIAPFSSNNKLLRDERIEAANLEHRKEELEGFIFKLSMYEEFMDPIFSILDNHYKETDEKDQVSLLAIRRIDRRTYKYEQHPENKNQVIISPVVEGELKEFVEEEEKEKKEIFALLRVVNWATDISKNNKQELNTYENWRENQLILTSYKHQENNPLLVRSFKSNSMVAYIGLEYHFEEMDNTLKTWCVETILQTGMQVIEEAKSNTLGLSIGLEDEENVVKAFPLILQQNVDEDTVINTKFQIIQALLRIRLNDNIKRPIYDFLGKKLWTTDYTFATQCFRVLYLFTLLVPPQRDYRNDSKYLKELKEYNDSIDRLVSTAMNGNIKEINLFNIDFLVGNAYYLDKVFFFLPEKEALSKELNSFRKTYEKALIKATYLKPKKLYQRPAELMHHEQRYQVKSARLLFFQNEEFCRQAFRKTISYVLNPCEGCTPNNKTVELISRKFRQLVYLQNNNQNNERF